MVSNESSPKVSEVHPKVSDAEAEVINRASDAIHRALREMATGSAPSLPALPFPSEGPIVGLVTRERPDGKFEAVAPNPDATNEYWANIELALFGTARPRRSSKS
jgi:hypothetical protein